MTGAPVRHPLFARLYTLMSRAEPAEQVEHRRQLVDGLSGRVLEIGAGTGLTFPFYPSTADELVAVEPEAYLRAQATAAAARAPVPVTVVDGTALSAGATPSASTSTTRRPGVVRTARPQPRGRRGAIRQDFTVKVRCWPAA